MVFFRRNVGEIREANGSKRIPAVHGVDSLGKLDAAGFVNAA